MDGLHKISITQKDSLGKYQVEVFVSEDAGKWRRIRNMGDFAPHANNLMCEKIKNTALISILK